MTHKPTSLSAWLIVALWVVPASLCAGQAAPSNSAQAVQDKPLRDAIVVESGSTCLQQTRVVEDVQVWLGRDHVQPQVRVVVRGHADHRRSALFDITHGGPVHRRVFDALPDICGDAHAVLSLAIALAIDAEIQAQWEPTDAAVPVSTAWQLHAQATLAYEVLPDLALGGGLGGSVRVASWLRLRTDLLVLHSRDDVIAQSRGSFDATWVGGSVSACAGGEIESHARLWLCVGAASAAVYAQGRGYSPNRSAIAP